MRRVLTALLLIPMVLALVWWAPRWLVALGVLLVAVLAVWEYLELAEPLGPAPLRLPVFLATAALCALAAIPVDSTGWLLVGFVLLGLWLLALEGMRRNILSEVLPAGATSILGLAYVVLPLSFLVWLTGEPRGRPLVLYGLLITWVGDTAAYYVGKSLGRHALAPRLSPKKTWEGTLASLLATLAVGVWLGRELLGAELALIHLLGLAAVANMASQIGDLTESALKRGAHRKDSSHILPGHGGVLDRIDGLLFVSPVLLCYYLFSVR
jgi:phosphatidate cytidylyltransferase